MIIIFWLSAAAFVVLAVWRLELALQVLLFLLPTYLWRTHIFGVPTTFLEVMILTMAIVWLIKNRHELLSGIKTRLKGGKTRRYPFDWEMIGVLIVALLSAGIAGFSLASMGIFKAYFFEPILLFLIIFNVIGPSKEYEKITRPLILSGVAVALVTWYQYFFNISFLNPSLSWQAEGRAVSIYGFPNAIGLYLAPLVALAVAWLIERYKKSGWQAPQTQVLSGAVTLMIGALVFAKSEGALIGLLAACLVLLFCYARVKKFLLVFFIMLVALMAVPQLRNLTIEKATLSDLSGVIRQQQWRETWQMLKTDNRFLFGFGLDNFQQTVAPIHQEGVFYNFDHDPKFRSQLVFGPPEYKISHWRPIDSYKYPHNIFLNFWVELGILGALLFVWIIIKYLTISAQLAKVSPQKWLVLGLIAMMTAQIVHGLVDAPYFKNDLAVLFWVEIALLSILLVNAREQKLFKSKK